MVGIRRESLQEILARAPSTPLVVAGDLIADRYILGSSGRVSREAPVLILQFIEERTVPGGAANAAMNLRALGAPVKLVGVVGADGCGEELLGLLRRAGVDVSGVAVSGSRGTTVKTRILAGDANVSRQQVVRVDRDQPDRLAPELERSLVERLEAAMDGARGVLLSDYGQGVLSGEVRARAIQAARDMEMMSCADSRRRLLHFRGVGVATPNIGEAQEAVARDGATGAAEADAAVVGPALLRRLEAKSVVITRGSAGMDVHERDGRAVHVEVVGGVEVVDVTGAGDTVSATVALALAAGGTAEEAAVLASHAAGIVVNKRGTATASAVEVARSLRERWASS